MTDETHDEAFKMHYRNAERVIFDMYGHNTPNSNLMLSRLKDCKTYSQINNTLAWGRVNLLK